MIDLPSFENSTMDSGSMPLDAVRTISAVDFQRLEKKMDRLGEAIGTLVRVEERQTNHAALIAEIKSNHEKDKISLEKDIEANRVAIDRNERLLQQWIQRGIGAWVVVTIVASIIAFAFTRGH